MSMKHGRYYTIALYDRIHVRLNENERMGTKKRVAGENLEEEGCTRAGEEWERIRETG